MRQPGLSEIGILALLLSGGCVGVWPGDWDAWLDGLSQAPSDSGVWPDTELDADTDQAWDCEPVDWTDGSSGTYVVNSAADDHVHHHLDMPADTHRLIVTANWSTSWNMDLSVGIGWCSNSGISYAEGYADAGELSVELAPGMVDKGAEVFTEDIQWFAKLSLYMMVGAPDDGEAADYVIEALACTWVE